MKVSFDIDDRIVKLASRVWGIARHRGTHALLGVSVLVGAAAIAHAATKKHTFSAGTPALAAQVNENFDDIFAAVTAIEDALAAKRSQSIWLAGSTANDDVALSNNGYYYLHPEHRGYGQVSLALPAGSVIVGMTCYVYNNSAIPAGDAKFTASLRRLEPSEAAASVLAELDEWPAQQDGVRELSVAVPDGTEVDGDSAYFLQFGIDPGDATSDEYYPADGCTECRRLLRHYGCRLDYEAP